MAAYRSPHTAAPSATEVRPIGYRGADAAFASVLDKHLLDQSVGITVIRIVATFALLSDVGESAKSQRATGVTEGPKGVLSLP